MALPLVLLLPLLIVLSALAYLALQQAAEAWLKPLLQWLFAPRQSFWKRVLFWPVREIGKGLMAVMRYVMRILGGAFFLAASSLGRFLHGLAWVLALPMVALENFAQTVLQAFTYLRNVAIPRLIEVVVGPVRTAATLAKVLADTAVALLNGISVEFGLGLRSLPWGSPFGLVARVAAFWNAFAHIWTQVFKHIVPRLDLIQYTTLPRVAGRVDDIFTDLYRTGRISLPGIRRRLADVEAALSGILFNPLAWLAALLTSVAGIAMLTQVLAKVAPQLFCRNTTGVAKRLCALDEAMLANLLAGTLLFALVLDPRALARVAEGVTVALDGVTRATVLR